MLNPVNISALVHDTLFKLGVKEISIEKLVKATFVMESNLSNVFDHSNKYNLKRGLMLMDDKTSIEILEEYLKFRPLIRGLISQVCAIDLERLPPKTCLEALESNIRLMVAVTYAYYSSVYDKAPEDDLNDIGRYYYKYYTKTNNIDLSKFIETYKSTFMNK